MSGFLKALLINGQRYLFSENSISSKLLTYTAENYTVCTDQNGFSTCILKTAEINFPVFREVMLKNAAITDFDSDVRFQHKYLHTDIYFTNNVSTGILKLVVHWLLLIYIHIYEWIVTFLYN
jgi:hypothetical protein